MNKSMHRKIPWTPEDRARHKAIREKFQKEKPSLDDLLDSGDSVIWMSQATYRELRQFLGELKGIRESMGLTLEDVSKRSGIDPATLSRLETGKQPNPTVDTLSRYASAVGKSLALAMIDPGPKGGRATS